MSGLPGFYLDAVVALEIREGSLPDEPSYRPVGSGVLVGRPAHHDQDPTKPPFYVYLVTNRHVVEAAYEGFPDLLYIKINVGGRAERFRIGQHDEFGDPLWYFADGYDVAVTYIADQQLTEAEADYTFIPQHLWLLAADMEASDVGEGDDLWVCGFPMGLAGRERKYSIVRAGMIARADADIIAETGSFLIDCAIFPGNSGGPVFLRSTPYVSGRKLVYEPPSIVGIVESYLPYEDVAISVQTQRPRVTFEENSGLASVVPMEAVLEACEACVAGPRPAQEPISDDPDGPKIASHAVRLPSLGEQTDPADR
jgi:hypothetical protein